MVLRTAFAQTRSQTERLAALLSPEDQTVQSMPDASPTKWHLAHTAWFFETFVLRPLAPSYPLFDEHFESLFNSYYNSIGEQFPRARRGLITRPGTSEILAYRLHVDRAMEKILESPSEEVARLTELGIHHEKQHQELILTDIKHALGLNPLCPIYSAPGVRPAEQLRALASSAEQLRALTSPAAQPSVKFVEFEGGIVEIGHPGLSFHYDNEGPRHRTLLADFEIAHRPISNGDVLEFIAAGGYRAPTLWLAEGFSFIQERSLTCPLYWQESAEGYSHFTLHGFVPVDPQETACHLTFFEADAIARFFGARLPTEQEWEHAAAQMTAIAPALSPRPFDISFLRPGVPEAPSDRLPLTQLMGGVWEWTQSAYAPYPGYEAPPGAVGEYNGKFMHNQYVLRGGSCVTPDEHVRITYRNFFPSSACWQFSGARLARGTDTP